MAKRINIDIGKAVKVFRGFLSNAFKAIKPHKEPTYEEEGSKSIHCGRCDNTKEGSAVSIPVLVFNPFEDVKETEYYYDAVLWALENGITTGKDDTHFAPNGNCSRAEVVTFLWRAAGKPKATATDNPFVDVKENDYYYNAVLWAVEKGITAGATATTFAPKAGCTRAEVVTFLWRAEGRPEATATENPFTDVAARDYFYDAVLWAVEEGITAGTTETTFGSYTSCTRAQIVSFLYRANN